MVKITWLGHSFFHIKTRSTDILIDPWLSNPLFPSGYRLDKYDVIIVTHAHGDHIGESVSLLKKNKNAKIVCIYEVGLALEKQGISSSQIIAGNIGGPIHTHISDVKVVFTPATHSSEYGVATGAIIITPDKTVYHAGDTGITADMSIYAEIYKPDIFLVPIGGHYTMDPLQAAYAVRLVKPRIAIPMHYGSFPVLYGKPEDFEKLTREIAAGTEVRILRPGETIEV
ncbi:MAG: metal-dependent hydrolase [Fervidicoccaceae archaeon]|jgi:L-ascorbate metabolism protein UlaG (beta-lactamase superfamily)|nr:metal-dependent hydrolase [Fervidicoccaceae archaeon]MCC6051737.1 metal-dependent hydrolase [Fervidicoccaceae archaeon]